MDSILEGRTMVNSAIAAAITVAAFHIPSLELIAPLLGGAVGGYLQDDGLLGGLKVGFFLPFLLALSIIPTALLPVEPVYSAIPVEEVLNLGYNYMYVRSVVYFYLAFLFLAAVVFVIAGAGASIVGGLFWLTLYVAYSLPAFFFIVFVALVGGAVGGAAGSRRSGNASHPVEEV